MKKNICCHLEFRKWIMMYTYKLETIHGLPLQFNLLQVLSAYSKAYKSFGSNSQDSLHKLLSRYFISEMRISRAQCLAALGFSLIIIMKLLINKKGFFRSVLFTAYPFHNFPTLLFLTIYQSLLTYWLHIHFCFKHLNFLVIIKRLVCTILPKPVSQFYFYAPCKIVISQ